MLVRIVKRTFSGAEYCPEQKVLKLGGEGSTGVETLEFELPEEWAGMAVTVHVQQLDGTLPQPVLLGEDRCLEVDRMFTASEKGLWMLRAMDGNGYCAMTRPAWYECYARLLPRTGTPRSPRASTRPLWRRCWGRRTRQARRQRTRRARRTERKVQRERHRKPRPPLWTACSRQRARQKVHRRRHGA